MRGFAALALFVSTTIAAAARVGAPSGRPFCRPAALVACTESRLARPLAWPGGYMPLDRVLRMFARKTRVPASFVLARPLPNIDLPGGGMAPARFLDVLVRTHPIYAWRLSRGVVWFVDRRLTANPRNPLDGKLSRFVIFGDIGGVQLRLGQELFDLPAQFTGAALAGMVPVLVGGPLPRAALNNVTGREILQRVLEAAPTFYSQMIFPRAPPLTRADAVAALAWWQWVSLDQPPTPPPPPPGPPIRIR